MLKFKLSRLPFVQCHQQKTLSTAVYTALCHNYVHSNIVCQRSFLDSFQPQDFTNSTQTASECFKNPVKTVASSGKEFLRCMISRCDFAESVTIFQVWQPLPKKAPRPRYDNCGSGCCLFCFRFLEAVKESCIYWSCLDQSPMGRKNIRRTFVRYSQQENYNCDDSSHSTCHSLTS